MYTVNLVMLAPFFTVFVFINLILYCTCLLADWYSKLCVVVRWNNSYSNLFRVGSGVWQGSSLSPSLFSVLMNKVIIDLKKFELGCYIHKTWIVCIHYADDIILLSVSLSSLQDMLNKICATLKDLKQE